MSDYGNPGQCAQCGGPVLWTRSGIDPTRWNRPLDMSTSVKRYVVIDGKNLFVDTYVNHTCSGTPPAPVEGKEAYVANVVAAAKPPKTYKLSPRDERDAFLSVPCPVPECAAEANEECVQIKHVIRSGSRYREHWPHVQRRVAGLDAKGLFEHANATRGDYASMLSHERDRIAREIRAGEREKRNDAEIAAHNELVVAKTQCDRCGASRGVKCWNLMDRRQGRKVHTVGPHPDRTKKYMARRK